MRRIIALIDMDCFYAQVEQRECPELWGKPVIVVQHSRQGVEGGILAVSYEARPFGVKRGMSVADAKAKCSHLNVCHVPIGEFADKADIQKYRDASAEVFKVLNNFDPSIIVEKASVDEAFLDLTVYVEQILNGIENDVETTLEKYSQKLVTSHVANGEDESDLRQFLIECRTDTDQLRLAIAAVTVEEIRAQILKDTEFHCSAGVGNNKMMAKLVCARHKPRKQTIVPWKYVREILKGTPVGDVRGFGGKLGNKILETLHIQFMGDILLVDSSHLIESFPDQHEWLVSVAEGFDDEPVRPRAESSSIAVSKNFPGRSAIKTVEEMHQWVEGLCKELAKRLAVDQAQNKRTAENLVYSILSEGGTKPQKTLKLTSYHPDILFEQVWSALKVLNKSENEITWHPKVFNVSLSASRFSAGTFPQNRAITEWLSSKRRYEGPKPDDIVIEDGEIVITHERKPGGPITRPRASSKPGTSNEPIVIDIDDEDDHVEPQNEINEERADKDWIEVDGHRISRETFQRLPPDIKKQYEHRMALESARLLKKKHPPPRSGKKRQANLNSPNQQKRQKVSNGLEKFFKKKT